MDVPTALKLNEIEEKLQSASVSLDEALHRVHEALASTYAARAEARRRGTGAELEAARRQVAEGMASLFAGGSGGGGGGGAQPRQQSALEDVEARVAAEYEVAQNGRSLACCLRVSSERLYLAWGRLVFGALCWWYAIHEEGEGEGEGAGGGEGGAEAAAAAGSAAAAQPRGTQPPQQPLAR
jgi:hypothetical protein